jgi:hypothetical protein
MTTIFAAQRYKKGIKRTKILEITVKSFEKLLAQPASLIPHHTMHKLPFNRLLIRPAVLDFFSQMPEFQRNSEYLTLPKHL